MSFFVLANWFFCLTTFVLLGLVIVRYRWLLIKPSIIVIIFFHLMIQWAATAQAARNEAYLPNPWDFFLLVQLFPLIGLLVSFFIGTDLAQAIWIRVTEPFKSSLTYENGAIILLGAYFVLFLPIYFQYVPLNATGLYAILFNPSDAFMAREFSQKLLDNTFVRYGYVFMRSVFAPLLSVFVFKRMIDSLKKMRFLKVVTCVLGLVFILIAVSLSGARANAAAVFLVIIFSVWIPNKAKINPFVLIVAALLVFLVPTALTILREGRLLSIDSFSQTLEGGIFYRTFVIPMRMGLNYVHYTQNIGSLGMRGFSFMSGIHPEWINVPNMINNLYGGRYETGYANAGYIFAYFITLDIYAFPLSLLLLWSLDFVLVIYQYIRNPVMLISLIASIIVASQALISAEFTVVLLTGGLLPLLFISWFIDTLLMQKIKIVI